MAKIDLTLLSTPLIFTNPYGTENAFEKDLDPLEGKLWNTGAAVTDQAHDYNDCGMVCGESYWTKNGDSKVVGFDNSGLINGEIGPEFTNRHIAAIRLYKNNEYVYLLPGDSVRFEVKSYQELAYYLHIKDSEILVFSNRGTFMEGKFETSEDTSDGETTNP